MKRIIPSCIPVLFMAAIALASRGNAPAQSIGISNGLSALPALPAHGVPKPSGAVGGLKVLDWAGFKSAVTYTFDDALASQLANYAQLHATGVRMTYFLVTGPGANPGWAQIAKDGNELGNHTAHHCRADGSSCGWGAWAGSAEAEYDQATESIQQNYGVSHVWTTATPYGDTGYDTVAATRFFLNRGVPGGQVAPNSNTDPFNLFAYGVRAGETAATFNQQIDSAHTAGNWLIFLFHSMGGDGGYAPVNAADVVASVEHAKSLGDLWCDDMVNVGAYWAGEKAVTNGTTTQDGKKIVVTWTLPSHFPPGRTVRVTVTGGTLKQNGVALSWNGAGYYEVALDPGSLTITP